MENKIINVPEEIDQQIAVDLPNDERVVLPKDTIVWHGKSSKMPEKHVKSSFERAKVPSTTEAPCRDQNGRIASYDLRLV